ncbi:MAG TPA: M20/M25/M40 family metallo-hydrolase [Ignavibacteria bacterium]|nr:M20/M25/M40 family metallo-hydrolase [Ignavibacteria bacterium]
MLKFLEDILLFDSTSGKENELAKFIFEKYKINGCEIEIQNTSNGRKNLFYKKGIPKTIFCSHLDTVPPYIPPEISADIIKGRGSCDAKGQIAYLFALFQRLISEGEDNIGMLMVSGEEDGSWGAIAANKLIKDCDLIFIGEPTENKLVSASKGNICYRIEIEGKSCHSGYPDLGISTISVFNEFYNYLNNLNFDVDTELGKTTFNIGKLKSDNAHNVLSDKLSFNIFFRSTFLTHKKIENLMKDFNSDLVKYKKLYEDEPMKFLTVDGFETMTVSYGTDAPAFSNIKNKILYGPGSIFTAHTENEHIIISDLYRAVDDVYTIYKKLS